MPTSWGSPSPTIHDLMPYRFSEICLRDSVDLDKSKFSSTDEPSHATRKGFPEDSIPAVDKDKVETSDFLRYSSREIFVRDSKMDRFKFNGKDEPSHTTRKSFPEDSIPALDKDKVETSGDGCGSVDQVSKEPKKGTKIPCVSAMMILVFLCIPVVTGQSPQKDCWDLAPNCSKYKDDQFCNKDIDKHESDLVPWLFNNCQKTCICDKQSDQDKKDKSSDCKAIQYDKECQDRPPSEVFRNDCPYTCYYSRTPYLGDFQTSPKDQTFKEGMNVTLECSLNSTNPRVNITWFKNNVPIGPSERVSVDSNAFSSNLTIMEAIAYDKGEYHCGATNRDYEQMLSVNSPRGTLSMEEGTSSPGPNKGLVIGLVLGGVAVLVVGLVVCLVKMRKCKKIKKYSVASLSKTEPQLRPLTFSLLN